MGAGSTGGGGFGVIEGVEGTGGIGLLNGGRKVPLSGFCKTSFSRRAISLTGSWRAGRSGAAAGG